MSFHLVSILFLFFKIATINSVYVFIEPKEKFCLKKYRNITQVLHIIYSISGKEEDRNIITVYDPDEFNMLRELDSISNKVYLFVNIKYKQSKKPKEPKLDDFEKSDKFFIEKLKKEGLLEKSGKLIK
jgi:hypothetical protein